MHAFSSDWFRQSLGGFLAPSLKYMVLYCNVIVQSKLFGKEDDLVKEILHRDLGMPDERRGF
jgi:hypothetical protein